MVLICSVCDIVTKKIFAKINITQEINPERFCGILRKAQNRIAIRAIRAKTRLAKRFGHSLRFRGICIHEQCKMTH